MTLSGKTPVTLFILCSCFSMYGQESNESNTSADSMAVGIQTGYSGNTGSDISTLIYMEGQVFTNEMSIFEFLQGRVSGLDIAQSSGDPGKSANAGIRGMSKPLIVIDGIPQINLDDLTNYTNSLNEDLRSLIPVALCDINSIEVLKTGYATSLYGSEGSNGVILIETKKGKAQKPSITYQFNQSFHAKPEYQKMLTGDEYIMVQLEAWHNTGNMGIPPQIAYDRDYVDFYNYAANTDWIGEVTQPGNAANHYLGLTGSNKSNRLYGSINYTNQKGTMINTGYERIMYRVNFEHDFSEKLTIGLLVANSQVNHNENPSFNDEFNYNTNILETAFLKAPNMSIWDLDVNGNKTDNYFYRLNDYQGQFYNPVAASQLGNATNKVNHFSALLHLQYRMNNWLQLRESFSINSSSTHSDAKVSYSTTVQMSDIFDMDWSPVKRYPSSRIKSGRFRNELQAFLKIPVKKESRNTLEGYFTWISEFENIKFGSNRANFTSSYMSHYAFIDEFFELFDDKIRNNAAVTSLQYRFLNRYLLTLNTRSELLRSNTFSTNNNHYGLYAGWHFTSENFFSSLKFLNNGILHAGWSYSEYPSYTEYLPLLEASSIQPVKTFDGGIDLALFDSRIQLRAGWNWKEAVATYDIGMPYQNSIDYRNSGLEFSADIEMVKTRELIWIFHITIGHLHQITNPVQELSQPINKQFPKQAYGSIYGLINEGIYATDEETTATDANGNLLLDVNDVPVKMNYRDYYVFKAGDVKYRDINYDGTIDREDMVYLGSSFPKYSGGFGSTLRFKNLSITCNFHYRAGYKIINYVGLTTESADNKNNMSAAVISRWRTSEYPGIFPRAFLDHPANALPSDRYVKSGNFVKLNYINLSYNLNPAFCRKMHISGLTLSASAQRLFTLTGYNGMDPEIDISYGPYSMNMETIRTLPSKIITFSLQLTI